MSTPAASATLPCWACGAGAPRVDHFLPLPTFRCPECGLLFHGARGSEDVRDLYDDAYFEDYPGAGESYSDEQGRRAYEARRRIAWVGRHRGGGRLLEVGSAEGHFLAAAREAGFDVRGVEPAETAAQAARERSGAAVDTGFVEDVDLPAGGFDVACAWHVIEHIPAPVGALEHVRESLAPGGLLFVEVPNGHSLAAGRDGASWPHWETAHHVAHYGPAPMRALLERAGFEPLAVESFPVTGYYPPRVALAPGQLFSYVREAVAVRALPRRPHAWKHELLRAIGRRA